MHEKICVDFTNLRSSALQAGRGCSQSLSEVGLWTNLFPPKALRIRPVSRIHGDGVCDILLGAEGVREGERRTHVLYFHVGHEVERLAKEDKRRTRQVRFKAALETRVHTQGPQLLSASLALNSVI